jgi:serine/threonine-protein kinase
LAALNHPNIASIYGLEEFSGTSRAIVMELVDGSTLADRLRNGALPREEAIAIAQQIVAALEAAHERGVVHRDLKPANIKTPSDRDATVKVLDFGLATAIQTSASEPLDARDDSPTLITAATEMGVILGTAGYMSPEQAAGKNVDKRADIWAFGTVLWEMLMGEPLFAGGESVSYVLADVLRAPIPFERIPAGPLRELLRRCLDRDVKTRLRDIGEARVALARIASGDETTAQAEDLSRTRRWAGWAFAVVLAIATVIALGAPWRTEPERPLMRLEVDLGGDVALTPVNVSGMAISPDGIRLAYTTSSTRVAGSRFLGFGQGAGGRRVDIGSTNGPVFIRHLSEAKGVALPGTEGATRVFFSPDGQWVAFSGNGGTRKIPVEGGPVVPVYEQGVLLTWAEDGSMVLGTASGLVRIPAGAGSASTIPDTVTRGDMRQILPGGRVALVVTRGPGSRNASAASIEAVSLADGKHKVLVPGAGSPQYLPTGHLST